MLLGFFCMVFGEKSWNGAKFVCKKSWNGVILRRKKSWNGVIMKRKMYQTLLKWKQEEQGRKALMLDGARRVGKSYIVEEFARNEYASYILIDFAHVESEVMSYFENYKTDFDALFFPGGFGAAKNLCNYAFKGADMEVQPDVARAILEMHEAQKPIGAMCIAPVMLARLIPDVCVTLGAEGSDVADHVRSWGAHHVQTEHGDVCADNGNRVFTTPAFMLDASLKDVYDGAYNMVEAVVEELKDKR